MRTFAQMLTNIRKSDDALREAVSEAAAYITLQYHKNNRKADGAGVAFMPQFVNALPAWLQKEAGKWALQTGKRIVDMTDNVAAMRVDAMIGVAFASQDEKRRIARENRVAKKAQEAPAVAPQSTNADEPVEEYIEGDYEVLEAHAVGNALVINGELIELDAEEADALVTILTQMRGRATLKIAA